ncbi:hypothetical protein HDV02_001262 [Globomyces sp. JEL0801]|nr:hypothetical protein HDV02_001262 [Globomyces sp. JEL0801]
MEPAKDSTSNTVVVDVDEERQQVPHAPVRELDKGESMIKVNASHKAKQIGHYQFWEARRLWGNLDTNIRTLARFTWIGVKHQNKQDISDKLGAINLLLAFPIATKHYLRQEHGYHYEDLYSLLAHIPEFQPANYIGEDENDNVPLQITYHMAAYVDQCRRKDILDVPSTTGMYNAINALTDIISNFERIRTAPVPVAYTIHLKQTIILYILTLPFQLALRMGWATIPVISIAAFILLGIEAIGREIEDPFGYDVNDLDQEGFCAKLKRELDVISERPLDIDTKWSKPVDIEQPSLLRSVTKRYEQQ